MSLKVENIVIDQYFIEKIEKNGWERVQRTTSASTKSCFVCFFRLSPLLPSLCVDSHYFTNSFILRRSLCPLDEPPCDCDDCVILWISLCFSVYYWPCHDLSPSSCHLPHINRLIFSVSINLVEIRSRKGRKSFVSAKSILPLYTMALCRWTSITLCRFI